MVTVYMWWSSLGLSSLLLCFHTGFLFPSPVCSEAVVYVCEEEKEEEYREEQEQEKQVEEKQLWMVYVQW